MDLLSKEELDKLLNDAGLAEFKEEIKSIGGKGRKPVSFINPYTSVLRGLQDLRHMPVWLEDVITGATRTQGNTNISAKLLFSVLCNIPLITTGEIKTYLNRKRYALQGREVTSNSYCSSLRCAAVSAIKSIEYHLANGKLFDNRPYTLPYITTGEIDSEWLQISPNEYIDTETGEIIKV